MPSYEYQALDQRGHKQHGYLDADSARQARQVLRDRQLIPVNVQASNKSTRPSLRARQRISAAEIALFTQQFAALIQAAVPLEEALQVAADQTRLRPLKRVLEAVRSRILEGHSLAHSLQFHPGAFNPVYRALVAAGEHSGDLAQVLMRLADYTQRRQQLRNTLLQAAIYPVVLTLVALAVITLLMVYVIPKVVEQFNDVGQQLPLLTRIMINLSDFVIQRGWLVALVGIGLALLARQLLKHPPRRYRLHQFLLRLPGVGDLIIQLESARLLNTLSIMLNSGTPLLEALQISRDTLHNRVTRAALSDVAERVRAGQLLSRALAEQKLFPPLAVYMIANGEHSSELGNALQHAASQQETLLNSRLGLFTRLIEPLLILVFGAIVLAIVLAILLPILQLNHLTQF